MLCLNSLCLFISAHYQKICVDKTSWLVVSLNHSPSVWGPQTLKEQSERFLTFETMITFLTLENNIFNIHCNPSITLYPTCVPPLENIQRSDQRDLWHLRHWLQYRQLRTWINDNLCYLTINCDTGQHSQFLRCFFYLACKHSLIVANPFLKVKVNTLSSLFCKSYLNIISRE